MLNDYFNPNASKPQNGWQPQGFLGGMGYAQGQMQYDDQMKMQRELTLQHILQQSMQNEVYKNKDLASSVSQGQEATSKADLGTLVNRASIATPGYGSAIAGGEMGAAQSKQAAGKLATDTVDSDIVVKNMENAGKQWEHAANQLSYAGSIGGLNGQKQWDAEYNKLPAGIKEQFSPVFDPKTTPAHLKSLAEAVQNNVAERRKLAEEKLKADSAERIGAGNNRATMYAADQRKAAAGFRIKNLFSEFESAKTPEQMLMYGKMLLEQEDLNEQQHRQVIQGVATASRLIAEKHAKGQIDFGNPTGGAGLIADQINQRLGGNQSPYGGTIDVPGHGKVTVTGKLPDGTYLIQDPVTKRTGKYKP